MLPFLSDWAAEVKGKALTTCQNAAPEGAASDFTPAAERAICSSALLNGESCKESISIQIVFPFSIATGGPNPFSNLARSLHEAFLSSVASLAQAAMLSREVVNDAPSLVSGAETQAPAVTVVGLG